MVQQSTDVQQQTMATWLDSTHDYSRPRSGEVHEAIILSMNESGVIVDLSRAKRDGLVPCGDFDSLDDGYRGRLQVGDHVPVRILRGISRDEQILVSMKQGLQQQDWLRAQELLESQELVEAEVTGSNGGGVVVSFGPVRGFVPNSHLARGRSRRAEHKAQLVGQTLTLVVLEVNQRRRRLVLSERVADLQRRQKLLEELEEGQVRTGIVRNLVQYGAFVDLGGLDGLIHISELDWRYVKHPSEVLSVGDEIDVRVLKVDRERERVGLSRKQLLPNPWCDVIEKVYEGDLVPGTVTRVVSYGAFVDLGAGVEGLARVSDMPGGEATRSNLEAGLKVTVRVQEIDDLRQRISLAIPYAAGSDDRNAYHIGVRVAEAIWPDLLEDGRADRQTPGRAG
jgi:small subunit ribosomal protein S1